MNLKQDSVLLAVFEDSMTEIYIFYEAVLPIFTHINLLLQQEDPNIYLVADAIRAFLKKLFSKFLTFNAIRSEDDITKVDFEKTANHLDDSNLTVRLVTKQRLQKLLDDGDIFVADQRKFYKGVRAFYVKAATQTLQNCHLMIAS